MTVVDDCFVGEVSKRGKSSVHFGAGTFKETSASCDEEGVACEDPAWVGRIYGGSYVVAYGVLGVTWGCYTPMEKKMGELFERDKLGLAGKT